MTIMIRSLRNFYRGMENGVPNSSEKNKIATAHRARAMPERILYKIKMLPRSTI
jgi:hypothetical protein